MKPVDDDVEEKIIGTEENPRIIKLSKNLPVKEKEDYVNLMKIYTDVFAWSYEDLKEYDTSIIQHTISIKPGEKHNIIFGNLISPPQATLVILQNFVILIND